MASVVQSTFHGFQVEIRGIALWVVKTWLITLDMLTLSGRAGIFYFQSP
jgi:hypothetical protein